MTGYICYILVARQLGGIQSILRTIGLAKFSGVYKGAVMEVLENMRQDWKSLVLIKKEVEVRNPIISEKYPIWGNEKVINMTRTSKARDNQRKNMDGEGELKEYVKLLQIEIKTNEELRLSLSISQLKKGQ